MTRAERYRWGGILGALFVGLALASCSFESAVGGAECSTDGARNDGRVCRGGYWVAVDAGTDDCTPSEETCNGADDDCDGSVDEGCECQFRGLQEGVCSGKETIGEDGDCSPPSNWIGDEGASGGCGDMLDNDCDGQINENCNCSPGETRDCYSGSSDTLGVGICTEGTMTCDSSGSWGPCRDQVTQHVEAGQRCQNGEDDDCDGVVDEGCPCGIDGRTKGVCSDLIRDDDGKCPEPESFESPTDSEQQCDTLDNDCDGVVDEGCPCGYKGRARGVCAGQMRQADGTCPKPAGFVPATNDESGNGGCDGRDNDCDGLVDEGCSCDSDGRTCYTGPSGTRDNGPCEAGTQSCESDTWGATCTGETLPESEDCSTDVDENCDGTVNESCPCDYEGRDAGVCKDQKRDGDGQCPEPNAFRSDTDDESPDCDGLDNDCDGVVDEGCSCDYMNVSTGVCGKAEIDENGTCAEPEDYLPSSMDETGEFCDGKDNDCDGVADEDGCPCDYKGRDTGVCKDQTITSQGNCPQPANFEQQETTCGDGLDNDCDGDTDLADVACKNNAGASCSSDDECLGKCVSTMGGKVCAQVIFATSRTYTGNLGGLSGADAKCNTLATRAGIGGTWRAILSDATTSAKSRISVDGAVFNRNGKKLADGATDLWDGDIQNSVKRDEFGDEQKKLVWTGTNKNGNRDEGGSGETCNSWSSASDSVDAEVGHSDESDNNWLINARQTLRCGESAVLYCIDGQ